MYDFMYSTQYIDIQYQGHYIKNSPFLSLSLSRRWIPFFLTSARRAQQAHKSKLSEFAARMHQVRTSAFSMIMSKIKETLPPLLTTN